MPGYTFHLIPHTHWDREWYLTQSVFLARLVPALDELLEQLTSDSNAAFLLDGQTVLLEDYFQVRPERRGQVSDLVRSGRLQIGPWYILADELIPSGESLIRNLLIGQHDSELLGRRTEVLYSPDAFGHPAAWPQLAGEFGIRFGVLWRGLGGESGQNRDFYRWRAPDGREILLYHLPPEGYEVGGALNADPERLPRAWARVRSTLVGRAATHQVPVFIGADHHAAHPAISDLRDALAQLEPGNDVRVSRLEDFFAAAASETAGAPTVNGELRWSYGYTWTLQGVHATRAPLKRRHALAELALARLAEPLTALSWVLKGADASALLRHAWRTLLQSQFHDSIAGCTSDAVARRVEIRLDDARKLAREIARTSLNRLIGNDPDRVRANPESAAPQLVLWNPVPRARRGTVVADLTWFRRDVLVGPPGESVPRLGPGSRPFHLLTGDGRLGVQLLGGGQGQERLDAVRHYPDQDMVDWTRVAFQAPELNGFSLMSLDVSPGASPPGTGAWLQGHTLGNEHIEVRIGSAGTLELRDRRTRQPYRDLLRVESGGDAGDTYSYSPPKRDVLRRSRGLITFRPLARGPLVASAELSWQLAAGRRAHGSGSGAVGIRVVLSVYAGSPAVRCSLHLDNHALDHRLRLRLPTGLRGDAAVAGSQLGTLERKRIDPDGRKYPRETPVSTAPAHRYVAHAVKGRGLAIFAPGFFEYELDRKGDLLVTLLRSVGQLSRDDLPTRPGHAGWPTATPLAQCQGTDRLQLAIAPVSQSQVEAGHPLAELWEDLFLPVQGIWLRQASPLSIPSFGVRLEGSGLVFSALKPAERGSGLVLRCYNATGKPTTGAWHFASPVERAHRARADEQVLHEIKLGEAGRSIPFHAAAHEIVTIMVTFSPSS